jgi:hypothetical protein
MPNKRDVINWLPKTGRLKQKTNNNCPGLGSLEKDSFGALTYL